MSVNEIMTLLQNVAFPIFCTGILFKMLMDEKNAHELESKSFVTAINNNTAAIERIVDLMEHIEKTEIDRNEVFNNEKGNQS